MTRDLFPEASNLCLYNQVWSSLRSFSLPAYHEPLVRAKTTGDVWKIASVLATLATSNSSLTDYLIAMKDLANPTWGYYEGETWSICCSVDGLVWWSLPAGCLPTHESTTTTKWTPHNKRCPWNSSEKLAKPQRAMDLFPSFYVIKITVTPGSWYNLLIMKSTGVSQRPIFFGYPISNPVTDHFLVVSINLVQLASPIQVETNWLSNYWIGLDNPFGPIIWPILSYKAYVLIDF